MSTESEPLEPGPQVGEPALTPAEVVKFNLSQTWHVYADPTQDHTYLVAASSVDPNWASFDWALRVVAEVQSAAYAQHIADLHNKALSQ